MTILDLQPSPAPARTPIRSVAVLTLGCKLNLAESDAIARELRLAGCEVFDRPVEADAFVINSCSVTQTADKKSRHLVRLARRLSPAATILLTGCFPESAGYAAALATGADLVVPSRDKDEVVPRLLAHRPAAGGALPAAGRHTRAFVKAQEGCNDLCAFCIVPRTRGREHSVRPDDLVTVVRSWEEVGVQEVVITGTQLGAYGRDQDGDRYGPVTAIRALLAGTSVPRIRFSSLQPQDITPELLSLWEDPRLCRHFHLALQSGSDGVLRRMRRRYTTAQFRNALAEIRALLPDAAVTTDVLAGFPGETEAEHEESVRFCREAGFAQMHVFPYSRRPGTGAALMYGQLSAPVKRARLDEMLAVARDSAAAFRRGLIGRTEVVLWEGEPIPVGDGLSVWEGLTDNYVRVRVRAPGRLRNRLLPARLLSDAGDALDGELVGDWRDR